MTQAEQPVHRVHLESYYIDKTPVTFEQYDDVWLPFFEPAGVAS